MMSKGFEFYRKPYLKVDKKYKGGKGKSDVRGIVGDQELYKLSSNENMLGPSPMALEAVRKAAAELHYYPDRTDRRLCRALEEYYEGHLRSSQFLCANSGMELIDMICRGFLETGDNAIACSPAFRAYKLFAGKAGATLRNAPLQEDSFKLDIDAVLEKVDARTRIVFLNSPNNPTGTIIDKEDVASLLSRLPSGIVVVLDEVYFHFNRSEAFAKAYNFLDNDHAVIGVNSFSKTYGLAGLRMGYLYGRQEVVDYLRTLTRPFQISHLSMEAAIAALRDRQFVDKTVALVNSEKEWLYSQLDSLEVKYWKSEANFIMIKPEMGDEAFELEMLKSGVMVRPVSSFGAEGCVRVTIGTREANEAYISALTKIKAGNE